MDRVLAIKRPFIYKEYSSKKVASIIAAIAVSVSYVIMMPALFFNRVDENGRCAVYRGRYPIIHDVYTLVSEYIFVFAILLGVIVASNVIFIRELKSRPKMGSSSQQERKKQTQRSYVMMLLALSCSFSILSLITTIGMSAGIFLYLGGEAQKAEFATTLSTFSVVVNNSVNLLFYYMSGDMFKEALREALLELKNRFIA